MPESPTAYRRVALALGCLIAVASPAGELEAQKQARVRPGAKHERSVRSKAALQRRQRLRRPRPRARGHHLRPILRKSSARTEPHIHGSAIVRGSRLLQLARRTGGLDAGLSALGLGHLPRRTAMRRASRLMDLSQPAHGDAYANLRTFRSAAFAGSRYRHWLKAALRELRKHADVSYVQVSGSEIDQLVRTARSEGMSLGGVRLLISTGREGVDAGKMKQMLRRYPEVDGFDIVGAETGRQSAASLRRTVNLLLRERRRPVLRIHAGEGYLGRGGHDNVNVSLRVLSRMAARRQLGRMKVILGHVARVHDPAAARRDLEVLAARGVKVVINVNPLSNLVYNAVEDVGGIAGLTLGPGELVPGSDNVGSLRQNREIVRRAVDGDIAGANHAARHVIRLRNRWRRAAGIEGQPGAETSAGHAH